MTGDVAAADDDGAVFVRAGDWTAVRAAESIVLIERRAADPAYTFRVHLRARGREVEE